jgi:hypothetical protein
MMDIGNEPGCPFTSSLQLSLSPCSLRGGGRLDCGSSNRSPREGSARVLTMQMAEEIQVSILGRNQVTDLWSQTSHGPLGRCPKTTKL